MVLYIIACYSLHAVAYVSHACRSLPGYPSAAACALIQSARACSVASRAAAYTSVAAIKAIKAIMPSVARIVSFIVLACCFAMGFAYTLAAYPAGQAGH